MRIFAPFALAALVLASQTAGTPRFEQLYPLRAEEGVFAYARISPDGHDLAYASEIRDPARGGAVSQTVTVVDLDKKKILFTEPGIDAYWSLDGQRIIYSSATRRDVSIWRLRTGEISRDVAPASLGDYYSWAVRDGRNLILTIKSNYYYLDGDSMVVPAAKVGSCPEIGVGDRPLISKDGMQITTFVRGTVVVRDLTDCNNVFDTGVQGAKADFSWDGRYIAFHDAKPGRLGYQIEVVDLKERTIRTVTNLSGSSLFPSWTRDGRLCFRYDSPEYRGFMMASDVLSAPARPLPVKGQQLPEKRAWSDVFPETRIPAHEWNIVMIWGTWSAHSPEALTALQRTRDYFDARSMDVGVMTAAEPATLRSDIERILQQNAIHLPEIPLSPEHFQLTEARNQIPTTLLFHDNKLVDRRLGPQSFEVIRDWLAAVSTK